MSFICSNVSVFLSFVWLVPPGKVNIMLLLYYFYPLYTCIDYVRKVWTSLHITVPYPLIEYDMNSKLSFLDSTFLLFWEREDEMRSFKIFPPFLMGKPHEIFCEKYGYVRRKAEYREGDYRSDICTSPMGSADNRDGKPLCIDEFEQTHYASTSSRKSVFNLLSETASLWQSESVRHVTGMVRITWG